MILLKVTAIKAEEAAATRTITTAATATATIVAIYVSSFVLPLYRSLPLSTSRSVAMGQHMFNCQIGAIRHNS